MTQTIPDTSTFEQKRADYRVAHDLLVNPVLQALDDNMEFRFAVEQMKPKLVSFDLELK